MSTPEQPRKLPPPIKPRKLMRAKNALGFGYVTSDNRYDVWPLYAHNRNGGRSGRVEQWAIRDRHAPADHNTRYYPLLDDIRQYYCAPGGKVPYLVCDMDDGVLRVEPTRAAAADWRTYFDDSFTIVRADRAHYDGWDPVQQPLYPYPDDPFERVERPEPKGDESA